LEVTSDLEERLKMMDIRENELIDRLRHSTSVQSKSFKNL
jgi:hypothetical protein